MSLKFVSLPRDYIHLSFLSSINNLEKFQQINRLKPLEFNQNDHMSEV